MIDPINQEWSQRIIKLKREKHFKKKKKKKTEASQEVFLSLTHKLTLFKILVVAEIYYKPVLILAIITTCFPPLLSQNLSPRKVK